MNYSAGMVSQVFAFVETKQTAELMAAGMSKDEIKDKVIGENLYQLRNETGLRRTFNYVYNRLSGYYIFDYDPREELYVRNHIACLIVVSRMDLKHLFTCIDMMLTQSAELEQIIFIGHRSM